jgi:hypothetical protein
MMMKKLINVLVAILFLWLYPRWIQLIFVLFDKDATMQQFIEILFDYGLTMAGLFVILFPLSLLYFFYHLQ